jgi:hypothetical protein
MTNKSTDPRYFHGGGEGWMEENDTPRTDSKSVDYIGFYSCATVASSFARELERELAASKAEVERLKRQLDSLKPQG